MKKKFRGLLNNPKAKFLLLAILSLCVSYIFFGENLKAEMGAIDDHRFLSSGVLQDPSLAWTNFLNAPEIKSFGNYDRFRIIYDFLSNIEVAAFGMQAAYFYLINILIFGFFIFCVFYITHKNMGRKWAIALTLFVISPIYFAHIFTRLGTAEAWTIFGLSIFSLGMSSLYRKIKESDSFNSWKEWSAMMLGSIIIIGSKENFAVLGVLVLAFALFLIYKKRLNKTAAFSTVVILLANAYQVLHIVLTQKKRGVDFYQNDAGILYRLTKIAGGLFSGNALAFSLPLILLVSGLLVFIYFYRKNRAKEPILRDPIVVKLFVTPLVWVFILAVFYLFNLYMYDGVAYYSHRYAFPSILAIQILFLILIKWVFDLKSHFFPQLKSRFTNTLFQAVLIVLLVLVAKNFDYSQMMTRKNVQATVAFQGELKKVISETKIHPGYPVVFASYWPMDYEPLISVSTYLRYYGTTNDLMVKTFYDSIPLADGLPVVKWVADENEKFEKNGGGSFVPYDIAEGKKCFFVDFSGTTADEGCENIGKIWNLGNYPY